MTKSGGYFGCFGCYMIIPTASIFCYPPLFSFCPILFAFFVYLFPYTYFFLFSLHLILFFLFFCIFLHFLCLSNFYTFFLLVHYILFSFFHLFLLFSFSGVIYISYVLYRFIYSFSNLNSFSSSSFESHHTIQLLFISTTSVPPSPS